MWNNILSLAGGAGVFAAASAAYLEATSDVKIRVFNRPVVNFLGLLGIAAVCLVINRSAASRQSQEDHKDALRRAEYTINNADLDKEQWMLIEGKLASFCATVENCNRTPGVSFSEEIYGIQKFINREPLAVREDKEEQLYRLLVLIHDFAYMAQRHRGYGAISQKVRVQGLQG